MAGDAPSPEELKELFTTFDSAGSGSLTVEGLRTVMTQFLKMNPAKEASLEAARAILEEVAASSALDLEAFSNIVSGKREFPDTKEELLEAFRTMGDPQSTGKIDEKKMRAILSTFGATTLEQGEIDDLVAKAGVDAAGRVEYGKWVETVYSS